MKAFQAVSHKDLFFAHVYSIFANDLGKKPHKTVGDKICRWQNLEEWEKIKRSQIW